jgi:type VI secretion system protein ImpK
MDEAVLSTPWGSQSEWGQQSLLVAFHREAWGGERFFERLDQLKQDPARHIDLLELHYLCLAVGFMGRYQVLQRGDARLAEVQQGLYRAIRTVRGAPADELSLQWRGLEDRRHRLVRYVPWWVVGAGVLAALSIAFVVFRTQLGTVAEPVYKTLVAVGQERYQGPAPPVVVSGPRLKELLPSDAALSVVEEGGRTRIILAAPDLFASGSPTPNPVYLEMLNQVGAALERVPGEILVEGHTDDQPLRSLTYANNFELSRARAANVVRVLQRSMSQPARLKSLGVGSERPRHTPESLPENRARNRRVEIVHVQGV